MNQPAAPETVSNGARDTSGLQPFSAPMLESLIHTSGLGIALLGVDRRWLYINPAARTVLGSDLDGLVDTPAPFRGSPDDDDRPIRPGELRTHYVNVTVDGAAKELEYTEVPLVDGQDGRIAVMFWDVTQARQQERRLAAFGRTASSLAYAGPLQQVLDRVAADVLAPAGALACAIVLIDPHTQAIQLTGTAGHQADYVDNIERCRRLGAPLVTWETFQSRQPRIRRDIAQILADPRYQPMHASTRESGWAYGAAVPLIARDKTLGVLETLYPAGHDPTSADTDFLAAIADQVAIAVDNARLLGELEDKAALEERHRLARDLHDSVSQALFSMSLHARAVQIAAQQSGADPEGPVARGVAQLRELTQAALGEMRALILQLRPEALHDEGLIGAVRKHAEAVSAREELDVHVHADADRLPLEQVAEEQVFRVVQEAIHNSVKHASAHHIDVHLVSAPDDPRVLVVEVSDDGSGFEPQAPHPGRLGLISMRERIESLGGSLILESSPAGSRVRAELPGILAATEVQA